jgi:ParB family chromosome partitioning protein
VERPPNLSCGGGSIVDRIRPRFAAADDCSRDFPESAREPFPNEDEKDRSPSIMTEQTQDTTQPAAKRRLGRGLNALLSSAADIEPRGAGDPADNLIQIDVGTIERNPFQPRKDFETESLGELVESIKQHGILQPLLVRPHGSQHQLIAGERRWLAAKKAGLAVVPCRVMELEDQRVCEVAIEENLKRKDLNVLEKAQAFQDYLDRFGSTIEELARQLSMNRSTVSNLLRLLELPEKVKQVLRNARITSGHARALLPLEEADQLLLCKRIQAESWSVRKTEQAVRELQQGPATIDIGSKPPSESPATVEPNNHVRSLVDQLRSHLGLKIEIRQTGKETGKIIIPFESNDDFQRIVRHLRRVA